MINDRYWRKRKERIKPQKQKQPMALFALTSGALMGSSFISDWIDLVDAVLILFDLTFFALFWRTKNLIPVFRTVCFSSKLGKSLIFLPLFLEAYSSNRQSLAFKSKVRVDPLMRLMTVVMDTIMTLKWGTMVMKEVDRMLIKIEIVIIKAVVKKRKGIIPSSR